MKQSLNLGACGWAHKHWAESFYPEDLPVADDDDWRLSYYSNEYNTVLVPANYWQSEPATDCADWLDSVHADFRFFVECRASMLETISLAALSDALKALKPQLSALVFLDESQAVSDVTGEPFVELAQSLDVELLGELPGTSQAAAQKIWRPEAQISGACFALIEDDLSDLRAARAMVEQFVAQVEDGADELIIIIDHPQLPAENLSKFRSVLEIMGY